jgi:hypothetical protein
VIGPGTVITGGVVSLTSSKAPMSQPASCGRLTLRWSPVIVVPQPLTPGGIASIGGLPNRRAIVCVGPPLSFRPAGSSIGFVFDSEWLALLKPQLVPSSRL